MWVNHLSGLENKKRKWHALEEEATKDDTEEESVEELEDAEDSAEEDPIDEEVLERFTNSCADKVFEMLKQRFLPELLEELTPLTKDTIPGMPPQ